MRYQGPSPPNGIPMRDGNVLYLLAGRFYRMAYTAFGDPAAPPVVCVHGLTRTGRDFDALATALSDRFHVVCPDLPGRGESDWLADSALYVPPSYVAALGHLLAVIGRPVGWVGTSLGGICGMAIAAADGVQPIERLVLNDMGPFIPAPVLKRIGEYVGAAMEFDDQAALEAHIRTVNAPFGNLSDTEWQHLSHTASRQMPDGRVRLHYDPAIAAPFKTEFTDDIDLWPVFDRIRVPVLAIRGEHSDLLLPETLERMEQWGALTLTVPDCGHAPALMDAPSIEAIQQFLSA